MILKSYSTCGVGYGSLWIAFYIGTKDDCCIVFPVFNLLTRAKGPGWQPDLPISYKYSQN
ncbi:hypothetical protein LEP1GSC176_2347 [Leptospira kirschneri str. MMD1493]|nr:hypothetical protein LEP1GSC176_2347 [Leptospira kirschneri str. MMD1493]